MSGNVSKVLKMLVFPVFVSNNPLATALAQAVQEKSTASEAATLTTTTMVATIDPTAIVNDTCMD